MFLFINGFSDYQKSVFLHFAEKTAIIDGKYLTEEIAFLHAVNALAGQGIETQKIDIKELPNVFTTRKERACFLLEILKVAHCDNDYAADEQTLSEDIASVFGFTDDEYMQFVKWVAIFNIHIQDALKLIGT